MLRESALRLSDARFHEMSFGMQSGCHVVDHPLVRVSIATLRNRETALPGFRQALRELTVLVGCEAMRGLETMPTCIETPMSACEGHALARPVIIIPILRAGLGMAEALLSLVPGARMGHVGLARDEETFEPRSYYFKTPPMADADVFVVDPMLATGQSAADALDKLKACGARRIGLVALIGSTQGIAFLRGRHPDVPIFLGAIDADLNEKAYIIPGLGDAGDRYFGT